MIDFEPFRPINLSMYDCNSKFNLDEIKKELLMNEPPFGFIVVDGCGALYATLQGNAKAIISKFTVELPRSMAEEDSLQYVLLVSVKKSVITTFERYAKLRLTASSVITNATFKASSLLVVLTSRTISMEQICSIQDLPERSLPHLMSAMDLKTV